MVAQVSLIGRGELSRWLRQPHVLGDLQQGLNEDWAHRSPFAWCERVDDQTSASFDRTAGAAGADFLAEVLKTSDRAREDAEPIERLLMELYGHSTYRSYLHAVMPTGDELVELVAQAEERAIDLLIKDEA